MAPIATTPPVADAAGCLAARRRRAGWGTPTAGARRQRRSSRAEGGDELDASRVRRSVFGGSRDEDADAGDDREADVREVSKVIDWLAPVLQGYLTGTLV